MRTAINKIPPIRYKDLTTDMQILLLSFIGTLHTCNPTIEHILKHLELWRDYGLMNKQFELAIKCQKTIDELDECEDKIVRKVISNGVDRRG